MLLQLDPRYPLVWRTPHSLQLGGDRPVAIVCGVTTPIEHLIGALTSGISAEGLRRIGVQLGVDRMVAEHLLATLRPAMLVTGEASVTASAPPATASVPAKRTRTKRVPEPSGPRWIVEGAGPAASGIRRLLAANGLPAIGAGEHAGTTQQDLAIIVADYAVAPARYVRWLSRDIPHLAVIFGDESVRIGPLVEPGNGPCLHCVDRWHADADPVWPAVASQLLGRIASAQREPLLSEVVARVTRIAMTRLGGRGNQLAGVSLLLSESSMTARRVPHRPHPGCGCRSP